MAGGGISQSFASAAGAFSLDLDLAFNQDATAKSTSTAGGRYQIFVDNVLQGGWTVASVARGATLRSHLSFTGLLADGDHELKIEMTRQYLTGSTVATMTPFMFVDNEGVEKLVSWPDRAVNRME